MIIIAFANLYVSLVWHFISSGMILFIALKSWRLRMKVWNENGIVQNTITSSY